MSFDVFLQRFSAGEPADVDRRGVLRVLKAAKHHGPREPGFYNVWFDDGVDVEFSASGLETEEPFTGCAFHIRGFGDELARFIYDVASAGDMVILPAMSAAPLAMVSEEQRGNIPEEILEDFRPILIRSGHELAALLRGGFAGWSGYRDAVIRRREERGASGGPST